MKRAVKSVKPKKRMHPFMPESKVLVWDYMPCIVNTVKDFTGWVMCLDEKGKIAPKICHGYIYQVTGMGGYGTFEVFENAVSKPLSISRGMRPHDTIRANTERNPDGHSVADSSASRASRRVNPAG